jgi:hypothetical protein
MLSVLSVAVLVYIITYRIDNSVVKLVCSRKQTPSVIEKAHGRRHEIYPSPKCCRALECLKEDKGRHAVLTTLRTDSYFPYLKRFACSVRKSNPNVEMIVASVRGDLSKPVIDAINSLGFNITLIYWDEFRLANSLKARYSYNWVKVRAWDMMNYDAIIMLDSDMIVVDDITHLFTLPTHFAAVLDEDKEGSIYSSLGTMQGGMVFLRPCRGITAHMINLLTNNQALQFANYHAEQDFFDWYFRYDRFILPTRYNSIRHLLDPNDLNRAGDAPIIVHYTRKPNIANHLADADISNCTVIY